MSHKSFHQLNGFVVSDLWLVLKPNIPNTFKMSTQNKDTQQRMCIEMHWNHIQNSNRTYSTRISNIFNTDREHTCNRNMHTQLHNLHSLPLSSLKTCRHTQPRTTGITTTTLLIIWVQLLLRLLTNTLLTNASFFSASKFVTKNLNHFVVLFDNEGL